MTQSKLSYLWMAVGVLFAVVGLFGLLSGQLSSILTLAIAALIIYTSVFQLGGWQVVKQDILLFFISRKPKPRKGSRRDKRRRNFKVIK